MTTVIRIIISFMLLSGLSEQTLAAPPDVDGDGLVGPQEAIDLAQSWKGPALPAGGAQPWQIDGATIFYNTGKVGIGSSTPQHQLRISGGPFWTSNLWTGSVELDNAAAIGWRANAGGQRFGIGQSTGGLYFFNTASDPGTTTSEAQYVMTITDEGAVHVPGSFGIGGDGSDQGARFQVNDGRIRIRESATLERWDLFYDPPSEKFYLQENAAYNHLVFTKGPEARVGIGTDEPNARFQVSAPTGMAALGFSAEGTGVTGEGKTGVFGATYEDGGVAVQGFVGFGASALSGKFSGDVDVAGTVLKSGDSNRIDHPLDPTNKYLFHSSVDSPDMMNIYNGNAVSDGSGYAEIMLPDYFEALNTDFRYQLTILDESDTSENVWAKVVKKMKDNRFTIRTSRPHLEVSWQVTGIRNDPYAKANPLEVEAMKKPDEKGKYLSPELYGQPKEKGIHYRSDLEAAGREKVLKDK